jgi:UDP-N-acetylmuramate-alanine ligase
MMREELFHILEDILRPGDRFSFLPVFYAGGTAAFTPTSEEVTADYNSRTKRAVPYGYYETRAVAVNSLEESADDKALVLIMGARDNSLSLWAKETGRSV